MPTKTTPRKASTRQKRAALKRQMIGRTKRASLPPQRRMRVADLQRAVDETAAKQVFVAVADGDRISFASVQKPRCLHLTGYWINKALRNFRCYECQCQFHIGDNLPANHPTKGIEVWRA